jgi:hypothetical protein
MPIRPEMKRVTLDTGGLRSARRFSPGQVIGVKALRRTRAVEPRTISRILSPAHG